MKTFTIEIKYGDEITPDNNIWMSEGYPDGAEAEDEEEAIDLAMDTYIEQSINAGEDVSEWERKSDYIEWHDEEGVMNWVQFKATEITDE